MNRLHHGFWYTTSLFPPGAYRTPEGKTLGIYQRGGTRLGPVHRPDGTIDMIPVTTEDHVVIQAPDGHDLEVYEDRKLRTVRFKPEELPDLELLQDLDHIPEARKGADWVSGRKVQSLFG